MTTRHRQLASMLRRFGIRTVAALLCLAAAVRAEQVGCYISVGDNDWVWRSPPVNSEASIAAFFDTLQQVFNVNRIYWRGFQSEVLVGNSVLRPENFQSHAFWQWERFLAEKVGTSRKAIAAAHQRDMDVWGMTALFDHGAHARIDTASMGTPAPFEDVLRVQHPEYAPIDRHGIRRQAGPIEFAYPAARSALVERYVNHAVSGGYDGLMFYTYVEHFSLRYEDEYGFSAPIVAEYKRRYGRDIRTETFDKHAWYRLRGEYVTQFLRELHAAFKQNGKKLGVAIDPQNPNLPAPWLCAPDVRPTGRFHLDWEGWVREGIVDEIMVYCNGALEKGLNTVLAVAEDTDCTVSTIHSAPWPARHQHLGQAGVRRVVVGSYDYFEWGYKEEQPVAALEGDDFLAKLRVLRQIEEKKTNVSTKRILATANDANVFVRRQALRTLASLAPPEAKTALETALADPETSVRCMAVDGLTKINDPESVEKIRAAMRARTTFQFENAVTSCLANMPAKRTAQIVVGCSDANVAVRRVTTYALGRGTIRRESVTHLLKAIDDPDAHVRFCAAYSLNRFSYLPRVGDALLVRLDREQHPSVRNRIAISLQACFRSKSRWVSRRQLRALEALSACFLSFGENGGRPDADWSFRPVGNALLGLGPRGRDVLENAMNQRGDRQLADFAWRILHVPQTGGSYATCTEAEAEKGYRQHPKHSNWAPVEPKSGPPELERMPYLLQNFNALTPYAKGKLGDYFHEVGEWRTFGDVSPEPVIQSAIKRGEQGNAVRLQRGGKGAQHTLQVLRIDYRLTNEHAIIEFWAYRATANAALAATWKDSGSGDYYVGVNIGPSGQIAVLDGNRAWSRTDAVIPHGVWQRIRLDIDGAKLTYGVSIGADKLKPIRQGMPLAAEATYNILTFAPQAPEGGIVYLDDVSVTVPNPAK